MFVKQENIVCTLKWPSLTAKKRKKSSFYEEKSLVGLTLGAMKITSNHIRSRLIGSLWAISEVIRLTCDYIKRRL